MGILARVPQMSYCADPRLNASTSCWVVTGLGALRRMLRSLVISSAVNNNGSFVLGMNVDCSWVKSRKGRRGSTHPLFHNRRSIAESATSRSGRAADPTPRLLPTLRAPHCG